MNLKDKWRAVVEDWKKSGLTQAEYSKRAGVKTTKLSYWKRKLELEDLVISKSELINGDENRNEFVEVTNPVKDIIKINSGDLLIEIPLSVGSKKIAELISCLS